MTAAAMPGSAFWVPEVWFAPGIRGCLRGDATVLFVVLQSRRETPLVDVVLDLFRIELRDAAGREHVRSCRFEIGPMNARSTVDLERRLEPSASYGADVYEVTLLGCLHGQDAGSGERLIEPITFWCDGDEDIYLHPAPQALALQHPDWSCAAGPLPDPGTSPGTLAPRR